MLLETLKVYKKNIKMDNLDKEEVKDGLYGIIANSYYKFDKEDLKEIALCLICCNDDIELAIDDYIERNDYIESEDK